MVNDFEDHVSKSVQYIKGHELIVQLVIFIKNDSIVYDLGCSTGKLLIDLIKRNNHKLNSKYFGIDIEKDMIQFAKINKKI